MASRSVLGTCCGVVSASYRRSSVSDKIPVILDTDIGSDIDDAVCLAYLLRQSRCDLLGVTTATGDTGQRAS
ncbi:nucleoside hydrolase, partial [Candidatus Poribacteria bacterium]|nr:nucleoside hydrolase [Candidatus Poribacteria bacterium]